LFSTTGRLQLSKKLDVEWQSKVIDLYQRVSTVLSDQFGYEPFLIYGTLLGAVREGGFIGHDFDFDAAYLSRATEGPAAAAELREVAFALIDAGFDVECKRTALHVHDEQDPDVRIDLFDLYFDASDRLQFPFGVAGRTEILRSAWQGIRETELAGHAVRIPTDAESVVEHIYGRTWRTPVAGFNWNLARTKRAMEAWTPREYTEEVYWANYYAHHAPASSSPFFDALATRDDLPSGVFDVGCGDGRDSFAFARSGRAVLGFDRSHIAIRRATERAQGTEHGSRLAFIMGDVADAEAIGEAVSRLRKQVDGGAVLFYLRFLLHSISEEVQEALLQAIAAAAVTGDMLAAEFRTDRDAELEKVYGGHYRRFQNAAAFSRNLPDRYGFKILEEQEGTGLSQFGPEDPVLYRVLAKKV
jgi:SAM-dependent methyltransferase